MSKALYPISTIRAWSEDEIEYREFVAKRIRSLLYNKLTNLNPAWKFVRCETPSLVPLTDVSSSYDSNDIFILENNFGSDTKACMRPETTKGSYLYAESILGKNSSRNLKKLPLCVWQMGHSHRRETNDGATYSKLRFNQFNQLEFQCIYNSNTKADYRAAIEIHLAVELGYLTRRQSHIIPSDRIPSYSENTQDIEVIIDQYNNKWMEICSISTRNDFADDCKVLEVAIGIDRIVELANVSFE